MAISLIAFVYGIVSERRHEQHDRLSMKPIIQIKEQFSDTGVGLLLTNKGLGPAYIKGYRIFVQGMAGEQAPGHLKPPGASDRFYGNTRNPQDYVISPNEEFRLFWYAEDHVDPATTHFRKESSDSFAFRTFLGTVHIDVCYCSVYDECWRQYLLEEPDLVQTCKPYRSLQTAEPLR